MNNLIAFIKRLISEKFYGKVIIGFEAGKIVNFEKRIKEDPKQFND